MYKIFVENIRCHSFHGCLPEETIIGGEYRVDVVVFLENEKLSGNDDLDETIDYCDVTKIVEDHMSVPCKLIETVCEKICDSVLKISSNTEKVVTSVTKINPPIDGDVEKVRVEIEKKRSN
jgi:dihydroneopterin aldolase